MKNYCLTFILFLTTLLSCTTDKQEQTANAPDSSYIPPTITRIADLPDSLKPEVIDLSERPEPRKIIIPKDESSRQSYIGPDGEVIQIKPPEKKLPPAFEGREEYLKKLKEDGSSVLAKVGVPHYKAYTSDDGLASNWITCATVDKRGHIWFGTWGDGLSKYDGIRFTNYSVVNGLASNLISSILEDQEG
ncbi:MAG TPA: two-component regulator propeller domain-containing protein, partial [Prolixibacteraceae bacterium]|nr:two-component regulator propeller domain-containing protein [Prolixibacteraceae bacterium]